MASPSVEQRIIREISRRGTCSFLDLKSSLRLSRGDIEANTDRLFDRGLVKIKKDTDGNHTFYTWTGPKEEARVPDHARPGVPLEGRERGGGTIAKKKQPASPESLPPDWKQRLEQSIAGYSHHPKEQEIMLGLLRKKEVEKAANLIWKASRKVNPKWDASLFLERFQEVLFHLAVYYGLRRLTVKDFREMAAALEMIRDNEPFREGPAREELERRIPILRHRAENMSKTKPKDLGKRGALQYLRQYFQKYLQKPLNQATTLLYVATFGGKCKESTVRVRASERAASGLKKATVANMTKKAWAAIDKLEGEEYEAALEKMSPRLQRRYLQSGG